MVERFNEPHGQLGICGLDLRQQVRGGAGGRAADLRLNHDLAGVLHLLESQVKPRLHLFADGVTMIFRVVRYADNGERLVLPIGIVDGELPANRVLSRKEVLDQGLVYNGHARGSRRILRFDAATSENWNSDDGE